MEYFYKTDRTTYDKHKELFEKTGDISALERYGDMIKVVDTVRTKLKHTEHIVTTFILEMPRLILSQFNKHGIIRSNTSSTRAIPSKRVLETFETNKYYIPPYLFKNGKGMFTKELVDYDTYSQWWNLELAKLEFSISQTKKQLEISKDEAVHKQHNRSLEPWQIVRVVATSTEWDNYLFLRDWHDVQPEFWYMARKQKESLANAFIRDVTVHLPYGCDLEDFLVPEDIEKVRKGSVLDHHIAILCNIVKAAAISYYRIDDKYTLQDIKRIINNLLGEDGRLHGTPFEHVVWMGYSDDKPVRKSIPLSTRYRLDFIKKLVDNL